MAKKKSKLTKPAKKKKDESEAHKAHKRDMQAIENMDKANQRLFVKHDIRRKRILKNTRTGRTTTRQFINQLEGNSRNFNKGLARTTKAFDAGAFHEALPAKKKKATKKRSTARDKKNSKRSSK